MAAIFSLIKALLSVLLSITSILGFGTATTEVELYANPDSGYTWEYSFDDESVLALSGSRFRPDTSDLFAGGGKQCFTFREIGSGTVNITFEYTQTLTGEVASRYVYTYEVSESGKITLVNIA